ncbi:MAG: fimbria major subunit [Alloprevotella sp.]|nr:fimbria major subunit [Alloprevotella sp.]
MLRFVAHILPTLCWLCFAGLACVACSDHDDPSTPDEEEWMTKNGTYLQLTLYTQTRTGHNSRGPQGDEDGDYRLGAFVNEYEARNATILLYSDAAGINGSANTTIDYALYAPTLNPTSTSPVAYKTDVLHYSRPLKPGIYHVIVIVNAGDRTDLEGKTLGEVRDERMGDPYLLSDPNDPTSAHTFVMSNEKDATIDLTGPGGVQNVKTVEVDVERLAARIDFSPGVSYETPGYYGGKMLENKEINGTNYPVCFEYQVLQEGTTNTNDDRFYLTSVQPINLWTNKTYLIKRVSDIKWADENHLIYLGDETTNALGEASRYVFSPYFFQRTKGNESQFAVSYGNGAETAPKEGEYIDPDDANLKYYILTYARENTISYNAPKAFYATALRLKGYYWKNETSTYTEKTYTYYIRHADPNNTNAEAVPMKYGIVRNNVYRISINRVNSLGVMIIETKDWITKELPPIYM